MAESLPWYPTYPDRFTRSRRARMYANTPARHGIYRLLLDEQWTNGPIPDDDQYLKLVCLGGEISMIREVLQGCFEHTEAGWINDVLEDIRIEQEAKHRKYQKRAKAAAEARWKKRKEKAASSDATSIPQAEHEHSLDDTRGTADASSMPGEKRRREEETTSLAHSDDHFPPNHPIWTEDNVYDLDEILDLWGSWSDLEGDELAAAKLEAHAIAMKALNGSPGCIDATDWSFANQVAAPFGITVEADA